MAYKVNFLGHIKFVIYDRSMKAVHLADCDDLYKEIVDMKECIHGLMKLNLKVGARKQKANAAAVYKLNYILNEVEKHIIFFNEFLFKENGKHYLKAIDSFRTILHSCLLGFNSYDFWHQKTKD